MLLEKLAKLYALEEYPSESLQNYVMKRIQSYDEERDIWDSFDNYVDYCIERLEGDI